MVGISRANGFFIFMLLILLYAIQAPLFGAGQGEDRLAMAEKLVKQKEYDKALIVLSELIQAEPDRFGEAASLANEIMSIRARYNKKLDELIDSLYNDRDVEKGLALIAELENLDPNADPEKIATARNAAELVANLNYFTRVMDDALAQIEAKKHTEAIATYLSVFSDEAALDMHREDFELEGYGNIIEAAVNDGVAGIIKAGTGSMDLGKESEKKLALFLEDFSKAAPEARSRSLTALLDTLREIHNIASGLEGIERAFKNQGDSLRKMRENARGVLFLRYVYQLLAGRQAEAGNEGLAFACRSFADYLAGQAQERLKALALSEKNAGLSSYDKADFKAARDSFRSGLAYSDPLVSVSYFLDKKSQISADIRRQSAIGWVVDPSLPDFMKSEEIIKLLISLSEVTNSRESGSRFASVSKTPSAAEARALVSDIRGISLALGKIASDWEKYSLLAAERAKQTYDPAVTNEAIAISAGAESILLKELVRILSLVHKTETDTLAREKKLLAEGVSDPAIGVVFYPDQRRANLERLLASETFMLDSLQAVRGEWLSGTGLLVNHPAMAEALSGIDNLASIIKSLIDEIKGGITSAESNITQAKKFRELGDIRAREAQTELKKDNVVIAKNKINDAQDAYYQSLSFQEDSELRNLRLKSLIDLLAQINQNENQRVVREVRRLVDSAKDHYLKGEFEQAQDELNAALARWSDTQTEEHPEIRPWLAFVKDALLIRSERELSEKSPLYKDISQLYNFAKDDYNNAIRLIKTGEKENGFNYLSAAQEKLVKITQQFPYNKDARLLILLILKETNPSDYADQFALRISNARTVLARGGDLQSAYNDLKDLEALDPSYPGLRALIIDLEVRLNLRRPPPDPVKIARSNELTEQARPIIEKRQIDLFSVARDLLRQALELNPNNKTATELLDRMGAGIGITRVPAEDLRKYDEANQLYIGKRHLEALNISTDLVTRYPGYGPFVELHKKIKAALGQI